MAQIIRITSEALQATIRRLLPSQQGFGEDLQASNVIQPIIDLTPSAEGSQVRQDLQTALAFGSQTEFAVSNATTTIISTPGFHRVTGIINSDNTTAGAQDALFRLSDGTTNKVLFSVVVKQLTTRTQTSLFVDFVVFLRTGDSLVVVCDTANQVVKLSLIHISEPTRPY